MPERAQLPVDKDVKAFKKYVDNLRRKWVTFSAWPAYTLFDYLSTGSGDRAANLLYRSGEPVQCQGNSTRPLIRRYSD